MKILKNHPINQHQGKKTFYKLRKWISVWSVPIQNDTVASDGIGAALITLKEMARPKRSWTYLATFCHSHLRITRAGLR